VHAVTTLADRPHTALLIIDVQRGVVDEAVRRDEVVANIATLVARSRAEQVPLVWVQHIEDEMPSGSEPWQIVSELAPSDGEPRIEKRYGDAFEDTLLETVLAELRVGRLVIAGAQTDQCIRCTLHGALARGYDATLVSDAHTTIDLSQYGAPPPEQVIAHTNLYWAHQTAPGRIAGAATAADVDFAPAS
jgi:nicotinamidase-related amidase